MGMCSSGVDASVPSVWGQTLESIPRKRKKQKRRSLIRDRVSSSPG